MWDILLAIGVVECRIWVQCATLDFLTKTSYILFSYVKAQCAFSFK